MFIRVDDRLVHGQVVTAWLRHLKAKTVLVADDAAAGNAMVRKALRIATPSGVELLIKSIKEASEEVGLMSGEKLLIIVRSPQSARQLIEQAPADIDWELNVGNVGKADGREKVTATVYLDRENYDALKVLSEKGIRVFYQTMPSDSKLNFS